MAEMHDYGTVSLRDFVESKIESIADSITIAHAAMERRLDSMNEFRETLRDQAGKLVSRDEYIAAHRRLEADIQMLREYKAAVESKASQKAMMITLAISSISLVTGIVGIVLSIVFRMALR